VKLAHVLAGRAHHRLAMLVLRVDDAKT
jgi:hypothetical protein